MESNSNAKQNINHDPENSNVESAFADVPLVPEVPIYAMMVAFNKDPSPVKLNLGIGVYRTEEGKPHVLDVVKRAEQQLVNDSSATKEYLPITGLAEFNKLSAKLIFGPNSPAIMENRSTTVQCLSGSGSLRIGADFLAKHYHQACAHNPTGVDPTLQQWEQIRQLVRSKGLLPFFDCAYQGFVSGDLEEDLQSVRLFVADGAECLVAQSYSKNMGLYGERVGALHIVCKDSEIATRVESQLKLVIRPMYSNPPIHGASIEAVILRNRDLYSQWTTELKSMTDRIIKIRQQLYYALRDRGTPGDWNHIIRQVGLFTFSGLSKDQVAFITKNYHIYISLDGRINMAGLSSGTIHHLANAMHEAVTHVV